MINTAFNRFLFSVFTPLVMLIVTFNPEWLNSFSAREKQILDKWNGIDRIQVKVFLLYLAAPHIAFPDERFFSDVNKFTIELTQKDKINVYIMFVFTGLFTFLGSFILITACFVRNIEGYWHFVGIGLVLFFGSLAYALTHSDKFAALYIKSIIENSPEYES